jgi:hypothetical protein
LILEFKIASYANLLADSEPYETSPPTNGRRDIQLSNVLDHTPFWAQNEQKMSFLKRSFEAVTDPRLNKSIKMAIKIAEITVVSKQQQQPPSYCRVAPSKGIALTANSLNPLAVEFVPSAPSSPTVRSMLNAAAKEFVPSPPRASVSKLNANAAEFVPSSRSISKLNAGAAEFVPSPPARIFKLRRDASEFLLHH